MTLIPLRSGDEVDAFAPRRYRPRFNHSRRAKIKRLYRRRVRYAFKRVTEEE